MLTLFPDEQILSESRDKEVVLTTHRITNEHKEWGKSYKQSIMLEHITSCENFYSSHFWLAILGGLFILSAIIIKVLGILIGIICLGIYWNTKKDLIIISSPSTKMKIKVTGMKKEKIFDFINRIEQAKNKRLQTPK